MLRLTCSFRQTIFLSNGLAEGKVQLKVYASLVVSENNKNLLNKSFNPFVVVIRKNSAQKNRKKLSSNCLLVLHQEWWKVLDPFAIQVNLKPALNLIWVALSDRKYYIQLTSLLSKVQVINKVTKRETHQFTYHVKEVQFIH